MTKSEFLDALKGRLSQLPQEELEKQLAHMDRIYEESHSAIARQLLAKIVAQ